MIGRISNPPSSNGGTNLIPISSKLYTQTVGLYTVEIQSREQKIFERDGAIQRLQGELRRKHPHDEHLDQEVRAALDKLDEREIGFVRWLLDHHRADNTAVQRAGMARHSQYSS